MNVRSIFAKSALVLSSALVAISAQAQTKTLEYGKTSVTLSAGFVSALQTLGVKPGVVIPSQLNNGIATFPVVAGAIDLQSAKGEILHSGGITLTTSATKVRLESFIIDTKSTPVLTGLVVVNDKLVGRLPLFDIHLPSNVTLPLPLTEGYILKLNGVGLTLNSQAATALNSLFHVTAFQGGFSIGTANVYALTSGAYEFEGNED